MEAASLPAEKQERICPRFRLSNKDAFINAQDVDVYLFGEGGVKSIFDRESRVIDWSTFSDVSEKVSNLYADILEVGRDE